MALFGNSAEVIVTNSTVFTGLGATDSLVVLPNSSNAEFVIHDVTTTGELHIYPWQSSVIVRNSQFGSIILETKNITSDPVDWTDTHIVFDNCDLKDFLDDADNFQDKKHKSIKFGNDGGIRSGGSIDGGGNATFTVVNSRVSGAIHINAYLENFARFNVSFNNDATPTGTYFDALVVINSVRNIPEFIMEGNVLGGFAPSIVHLNNFWPYAPYRTILESNITIVRNTVNNQGMLFSTYRATNITNSSINVADNVVSVNGVFYAAGTSYIHTCVLPHTIGSNVTFSRNRLTYTNLGNREIAGGFGFTESPDLQISKNVRVSVSSNIWTKVEAKRVTLYDMPGFSTTAGHHVEIINETVTSVSPLTQFAYYGSPLDATLVIRECVVKASHTSAAVAHLVTRRQSASQDHVTMVLEDNTIEMSQSADTTAAVGTLYILGPQASISAARNVIRAKKATFLSVEVKWQASLYLIENQAFTVTAGKAMDVKLALGGGSNPPTLFTQCNRVNGVPDRFYNPLVDVHPKCSNFGAYPTCNFTANNSACPFDPAPLENNPVTGATLPPYQPIVVKDRQNLTIGGGTIRKVVIIPNEPGSRDCLRDATIILDGMTTKEGFYIDGALCGGRIIFNNSVFEQSDKVYGSFGIRDYWDAPVEMTVAGSTLRGTHFPADKTSPGFNGVVAGLKFTNIPANTSMSMHDSTITGTMFLLPEAPFNVRNSTIVPGGTAPCFYPTLEGGELTIIDSNCTADAAFFNESVSLAPVVKGSTFIGTAAVILAWPNITFEDSTLVMPPATAEQTLEEPMVSVVGATFTRCRFDMGINNIIAGPVLTGANVTLEDSTIVVGTATGPSVFSLNTTAVLNATATLLNVTLTIEHYAPASTTDPVFRLFDIPAEGAPPTITVRDSNFTTVFATTAFPPGRIELRAGGASTFVPLPDVHVVVLGGPVLRGTFDFNNTDFGNFSTLAQDVVRMHSTFMTITELVFGYPRQIRDFQATGRSLSASKLIGIGGDDVRNREVAPPPRLVYDELLRLVFNGCTQAAGLPFTRQNITSEFSNLTAVRDALTINVNCVPTITNTLSHPLTASMAASASPRLSHSLTRQASPSRQLTVSRGDTTTSLTQPIHLSSAESSASSSSTGGDGTPAPPPPTSSRASSSTKQTSSDTGTASSASASAASSAAPRHSTSVSGNSSLGSGTSGGDGNSSTGRTSGNTDHSSRSSESSEDDTGAGARGPGTTLTDAGTGLGSGEKIGIALGVLAGVVCCCCPCCLLLLLCLRRRKKKKEEEEKAAANGPDVYDSDSDEDIDPNMIDPAELEAPPGEIIPDNETVEEQNARQLRWWKLMRDRRRRGKGLLSGKPFTNGNGKTTGATAVDMTGAAGNSKGKAKKGGMGVTGGHDSDSDDIDPSMIDSAELEAPPGETIPENETPEEQNARQLRWWKLMRDRRRRGKGLLSGKPFTNGKTTGATAVDMTGAAGNSKGKAKKGGIGAAAGGHDSDSDDIDPSMIDSAELEAPPGETIPENETPEEQNARQLRWWKLMRDRRRRGKGLFSGKPFTNDKKDSADVKKPAPTKKPPAKQAAKAPPKAPKGESIPENETAEEKAARELRWWKLSRDTRRRGGGTVLKARAAAQ